MSNELCTIGFKEEAYDSAAMAIQRMQGWAVDVHLDEDTKAVPDDHPAVFTATIEDVVVDQDTGHHKVVLAVWSKDEDGTDVEATEKSPRLALDIYDDVKLLEVC